MPPAHNVIAVVFDYDKTLAPRYMQEDAIFARCGIDAAVFWERANGLVRDGGYERDLAWMYLLLEHPEVAKLSNADLRALGRHLTFYPGLPEALAEMRTVARGVELEYYVITSGLRELVDGCALRPHVKAVFGGEYDERDGRLWRPKRTISHTAKTQMLFRVSKNLVSMSEDVNIHMPADQRRIPFANMIYVGDGPTDIPCFAVMTNYGGKAIAVYDPADRGSFETCYALQVQQRRVHAIAPADYRVGTQLRLLLERMILEIAARIATPGPGPGR